MWVADKAAQGYNDFYFADDAIKNVKAVKEVLGQIDVKSKVQQAKASKRRTFDNIVNDMIEDSSGIESFKKFSSAKARTVGEIKVDLIGLQWLHQLKTLKVCYIVY